MVDNLTSFNGIPEDKHVPNVLVSYGNIQSTKSLQRLWRYLAAHPGEYRCMMDSGAFSVAHAGVHIPLETFRDIVKAIPKGLHVEVFQLDVVDMPEKTLENYKRLRDWGVVTIPIFQKGGDLKILEECYRYSDLVGIAGGRKDMGFSRELQALIAGRKAHFLGMTKPVSMREIRPWSSDSITWKNGTMYGELYLWNEKAFRFELWRHRREPEKMEQFVPITKNLGFSRGDLIRMFSSKAGHVYYTDKGFVGAKKIRMPDMVSMVSWMLFSRSALKNLNSRIFLAVQTDVVADVMYTDRYAKRVLGEIG